MSGEERLLTPRELAEYLQVTTKTVAAWRLAGVIPCVSKGQKFVRYEREAVLEALRRQVEEGEEPDDSSPEGCALRQPA